MQTNGIDEKDKQILHLLCNNARMTYSQIGEQVGLSRTAVKTRVSALEKSGIITGYKAVIDPLACDEAMSFIVDIEIKPEHFDKAKGQLAGLQETVLLVQTTGKCHLTAICVCDSVQTMKELINSACKTISGILSINAHSVLEVIKGRLIP